MGIDTWESRTRDLDEKKKGLAAKARNKELLEAGVLAITFSSLAESKARRGLYSSNSLISSSMFSCRSS